MKSFQDYKMNGRANFFSQNMDLTPNGPPRSTLKEWHLNNRLKIKTCFEQQKIADSILAESDKQVDLIEEINSLNKREVEHQLDTRLKHVQFVKEDIIQQRKVVCLQIDDLTTFNERVIDAMANIRTNALAISQQCTIVREGRIGIDLCHDNVEIELLKETQMIETALNLLKCILDQSVEQIRRLRSANYFFDCDLDDKDAELKIDKANLIINEKSMKLKVYHGFAPSDSANVTVEEWAEFSNKKIEDSAKEVTAARSLIGYSSTLLKKIVDDLILQCDTVNEAFKQRIDETKEAKSKLEFNYGEISKQVNEMTSQIVKMEKTVKENNAFTSLTYTRMNNRSQRPGMELVKDMAGVYLGNEVNRLQKNCKILQNNLADAQAALRYMLQTQIQLEEDINVKANSLKIDEVDCMTLRQSLEYHHY